MHRLKSLYAMCLALAIVSATASVAEATHFRYGTITWTRAPGTRDVTFTVTHSWRSTFIGNPAFAFGDGTSHRPSPTTIATGVDSLGNAYTIRQFQVTKTYAHDGPFIASFQICCRISTLVNAADQVASVSSTVDLSGNNNASPVTSAPVILQMVQGGLNTLPLPIADPQGHAFTTRLATPSETGSTGYQVPSAGGNTIQVSPGGNISWDTSATNVGQLYSVVVMVEEVSNQSSIQVDFIIEIVGGTLNQSPTAFGTVPSGSTHVVGVGQLFTVTATGQDPDGDTLTVNHSGLPAGATLNPPVGSSGPSPFNVVFSWTPQPSHSGTAQAVTLTFTDPGGLNATYSFAIQVPANSPPHVDCPYPLIAECVNGGANLTLDATVTDADGDSLTITWDIDGVVVQQESAEHGDLVSLTGFFPRGQSVVSITVDDGLESHVCSTTITVQDTTAPEIVVCAPNLTVANDPGECHATLQSLDEPVVSDNCDEEPTLINDAASDLVFPHGTTEVIWTATDASGNSVTCTQMITVEDTEDPVVVSPADLTTLVDTGECFASVALGSPMVTDNCDPSPSVTNNAPLVFQVGETLVEWIVTDASGNQALTYQTVTVINTPPIADAGSDQIVECTSPQGAEVMLDGTASSDADGHELTYLWAASGISFDDSTSFTPTATFPIGATTVTLVVTDECGAEDTADVIIIVEDTVAPGIEIIEASHHTLWPANHQMVMVDLRITVSDDCQLPENLFVDVVANSDEPDDATGDGAFAGDVDGLDGYENDVPVPMQWNAVSGCWEGFLQLRAERNGRNKDGRKYSFSCIVVDHHGNFSEATVCVLVPHNKGR